MCDLVNAAHGVVFELDLDREYHRRTLETHERTLPADMPIAVAVRPGQDRIYVELLDRPYVWNHRPSVTSTGSPRSSKPPTRLA